MPTYEFSCNACGREFERVLMMNEEHVARCPECDSRDTMKVIRTAPAVRAADMFWEYEGNGRGRYISQLAKTQDDPNAYCRSRQEAISKAKAQGMTVQDA